MEASNFLTSKKVLKIEEKVTMLTIFSSENGELLDPNSRGAAWLIGRWEMVSSY